MTPDTFLPVPCTGAFNFRLKRLVWFSQHPARLTQDIVSDAVTNIGGPVPLPGRPHPLAGPALTGLAGWWSVSSLLMRSKNYTPA